MEFPDGTGRQRPLPAGAGRITLPDHLAAFTDSMARNCVFRSLIIQGREGSPFASLHSSSNARSPTSGRPIGKLCAAGVSAANTPLHDARQSPNEDHDWGRHKRRVRRRASPRQYRSACGSATSAGSRPGSWWACNRSGRRPRSRSGGSCPARSPCAKPDPPPHGSHPLPRVRKH